MTKKLTKYNFAVGFYWEGDSGAVGCYSTGSEVFYATLQEAKEFQTYCHARNNKQTYKIFQLVEVPE